MKKKRMVEKKKTKTLATKVKRGEKVKPLHRGEDLKKRSAMTT